MKVYQINVTARFSTGTLVKNIHNALIAAGNQARLAYGFGGQNEKNFYQITDIWHLRLNAKWMQLTGKETICARQCTKKLIADIKKVNPDLIHLHNIHGNYVDWKMLLKELAVYGKPVVVTLHDCWMFTGGCYHFTKNGCSKWKSSCNSCGYSRNYLLKKAFPIEAGEFQVKKKLYEAFDSLYVATVSDWLRRVAEESIFKDRPIYTVPNGIDVALFGKRQIDGLRSRLGCNGKKVLLGVASTWGNHKGLDQWIALSQQLSPDYQIVLVGLNNTQIRNLPSKMIGLARVSSTEELIELYNLADIYINLSVEETFGLPTVEAMACGTPVIVLNSTANPELVEESVGRVIEKPSVEQIRCAVEELVAIGKNNMGKACMKRARELYSVEVMCNKYLKLYGDILNNRVEMNESGI